MPTRSQVDVISLLVKTRKFALEFMENVDVEEIRKLHTPVLSVDVEVLTRDVTQTTAGCTIALVLSVEGLGLLNLKGKKNSVLVADLFFSFQQRTW